MAANLGKISITMGGDHVVSNGYERLTLVRDASTGLWYISIWDVPANIPLSNQGYWKVFFDPNMNSQQVAQNAQNIVQIFSDIASIGQQINSLLPKAGGTITGNLEVNGNLTKGGDPVATQNAFVNPLLNRSTVDTSTSLDPNSVQNGNPNHINIVTNHPNCPTVDHYHINTQWELGNANLRQIATRVVASNNTYIRTFHDAFGWQPWMRVAFQGIKQDWTAMTLINGWNNGYCQFKKYEDGKVVVRASVYNSSGSAGSTYRQVCTLPSGYRPSSTVWGTVDCSRSAYYPVFEILDDGRVSVRTVGAYQYYFYIEFKSY